MDGKYYNLWSTDNDRTDANDDIVIKSVYDPSPVGYSLPASNAFTGFTTTGQNVGVNFSTPLPPEERAKFNVKGVFDKGWYFYTKPNKSGKTFFFQASGVRQYDSGRLEFISKNGWHWTANNNSNSQSRGIEFYFHRINPLYINYRNHGFAVRSAEEKKWRKVDVGWRELQMEYGIEYHYNERSMRKG